MYVVARTSCITLRTYVHTYMCMTVNTFVINNMQVIQLSLHGK